MVYRVEIIRAAQKQLLSIPRQAQLEIAGAIDHLTEAPRPKGCKKLRGTELLGGLRRGMVKLAHDTNTIGVDIQPEFDDVDLRNRDWLPSVLGVGSTAMVRFHWLSAVAYPRSLANTHVIFNG